MYEIEHLTKMEGVISMPDEIVQVHTQNNELASKLLQIAAKECGFEFAGKESIPDYLQHTYLLFDMKDQTISVSNTVEIMNSEGEVVTTSTCSEMFARLCEMKTLGIRLDGRVLEINDDGGLKLGRTTITFETIAKMWKYFQSETKGEVMSGWWRYAKNRKKTICVNVNRSTSEMLQRAAKVAGFEWDGPSKIPCFLDYEYLFFHMDKGTVQCKHDREAIPADESVSVVDMFAQLIDFEQPIIIEGYEVEFSADGESIKIGCTTLNRAQIQKIWKHVEKVGESKKS